jgi:hypothetical protein
VQQENERILLKEQLILILSRLKRLVDTSVKVLCARYVHWTKPLSSSLSLESLADLARSKPKLVVENLLLRVPLIILKRHVKRPACTKKDRVLLCFARVAATSGIEILTTPYHAPRTNATCERFLGSVRRGCLDHILVLHEKQLHRVLQVYVKYFNQSRPHQGIHQQVPQGEVPFVPPEQGCDRIISVPILGGLYNDYRKVV